VLLNDLPDSIWIELLSLNAERDFAIYGNNGSNPKKKESEYVTLRFRMVSHPGTCLQSSFCGGVYNTFRILN